MTGSLSTTNCYHFFYEIFLLTSKISGSSITTWCYLNRIFYSVSWDVRQKNNDLNILDFMPLEFVTLQITNIVTHWFWLYFISLVNPGIQPYYFYQYITKFHTMLEKTEEAIMNVNLDTQTQDKDKHNIKN